MSVGRHGAPHPLPHSLDIPRLRGAARDPDRARAIEPGAVHGAGIAPLLDGADLGWGALARQVAAEQRLRGGVHAPETPEGRATPKIHGLRSERWKGNPRISGP